MASTLSNQSEMDRSLFTCLICEAVWRDPVTVECGHTFCRKCLSECADVSTSANANASAGFQCRRCEKQLKFRFDSDPMLRTNVLLLAVTEKCFPNETMKQSSQSTEISACNGSNGSDSNGSESNGGECCCNSSPSETDNAEGFKRLTTEDFECTLCLRLLFHPVTTPCGHTFCRNCIYRSLDHRILCPLCKESLADFLAARREATTEAVEKVIERYFAQELESRGKLETEEMMQLQRSISLDRREIPIFVCTIAFPSVACPLRIFEPRYRLMMRRCVESGTRQFGMVACLQNQEENFCEYGTILEIRDIQYQPDGESYVDCIGVRRFRVLSRGIQDGYRTGEVELLRDEPPTLEHRNALLRLHSDVFALTIEWFAALPLRSRSRIQQSFGNLPEAEPDDVLLSSTDGPSWIWFVIAILPLDSDTKISLLSTTSLRDRLVALQRILELFHGYGHIS